MTRGKLYVVATPIGNLGDMTPRGLQALRDANIVASEDTRRTRQLLSHFEIPAGNRLHSYHEHAEEVAGRRLLGFLATGQSVALCTDGGYPGISDPGYRLIHAAVELGIVVEVLPGASAIPIALLQSGLPTSSYTFKGFPPRKNGPRSRFFEEERDRAHTLVIFESPYRVGPTLQSAFDALGDRRAAVCVELTKKFERVQRGHLSELCAHYADRHERGEVTIVIAGNNPKFSREPDEEEPDADENAASG
jgi:16S rRNA (cytidine1402-2'-O)-methyltransferase